MTEVLFYHLQRRPLEQVLPILLERCIERRWRSLILAGSQAQIETLSAHLWSYRDDAFLPHGSSAEPHAAAQPILLTTTFDSPSPPPNAANILFLVDGAQSSRLAEFDRCVDLFDGNDPTATDAARNRFRQAREAGFDVTYWAQDANGTWEKRG